jgi:hypothetical protein
VKQTRDCPFAVDFQSYPLPSEQLLAVDLDAAANYPVGTGSAAIFFGMPLNNRRVSRLSARSNQ